VPSVPPSESLITIGLERAVDRSFQPALESSYRVLVLCHLAFGHRMADAEGPEEGQP
jgi:hypothetical protein